MNILRKYEKVALGAEYILVLHFSMTITMKERIKVQRHSWQLENNLRGVLAIAFLVSVRWTALTVIGKQWWRKVIQHSCLALVQH